jgi:hypothetical protein
VALADVSVDMEMKDTKELRKPDSTLTEAAADASVRSS